MGKLLWSNRQLNGYNRLYDPSLNPLWTLEQGLSDAEDGDHYSPKRDFFEWWYFDAAFDNGYRLVAILHSSLYNAVDHKPTVDIRITSPEGASTLAIGRYPRTRYRSAPDHCDVMIAGCHAVAETAGLYRLRLRQGDVTVDLTYERRAPGWRPGTGYLFADDATDRYFKWVVPVPVARVSGTVALNGRRMEVRGTGYHDHNWGNMVLADVFDHWYWGRVTGEWQGEPWAAVFGDVVARGKQPAHIRPFMLALGGEIYSGIPQVSFQQHKSVTEPLTGVSYPAGLDLVSHSSGYQAEVSLCTRRVMEALDFANSPFRRRWPRQLSEIAFYLALGKPVLGRLARRILGKASYLRLQSYGKVNLLNGNITRLSGDAIYEIMQFHAGE